MNGYEMKEVPFKREFELEGCLASNPELLGLDDNELSNQSIIAMEAFIESGQQNGDGRADFLVAYNGGMIGVVELKRGEIDKAAYDQLSEYMVARVGLSEGAELKGYLESVDIHATF